LEAAVDFQIADLRYRSLKTMEAQSHAALDRLIQSLRQLSDALAQLPATETRIVGGQENLCDEPIGHLHIDDPPTHNRRLA
jgi:hypothetical protein